MNAAELIAAFKAGKISTLSEWQTEISTGKFSLGQENGILVGCALEAPEHKSLIRIIWADWFKRQYPSSVQAVSLVQAKQPLPEHAPPYTCQFKVDDIIYLETRLEEHKRILQRYGHWWKFSRGYNKGIECLLVSIGKQKREEPAKKIEQLIIGRYGDWRYDVTNVLSFPCSEDQIPRSG